MKKFLFTLATLLMAGLAVSAQQPVFGFSESEISVVPGETAEVKIMLVQDAGQDILGYQCQWVMFNSAHQAIGTEVELQQTNLGTVFSPDNRYLVPGDATTQLGADPSESRVTYNGVENAAYRVLTVDMGGQKILYEGVLALFEQYSMDPVLYTIIVKTDAAWDEEYATLEMVNTEGIEGEDDYVNKFSTTPALTYDLETYPMVLKIKNANYQEPETPITGSVELGALEGYKVPVTVTDAPDNAVTVVTVAKDNGEAKTVEVVDGYITLDTEPAYGSYHVVATVTAEGYTGTLTDEGDYTIAQPTAATPKITFTENADGSVTVDIANYTEYTIKINGTEVNATLPYTVEQTYEQQVIEVYAKNAPEGYIAAEATGNHTLAAKEKQNAVTPVITFTPGETGVTIAVDPCTSYEVIVDGVNKGEINFVEKTWSEQYIVVNATNAPENYIPATATDNYTLAAKDLMTLEGSIVFSEVDQETGKVHVTYTGSENVTLTVDCEPATRAALTIDENGDVQLPTYGTYNLTGTATAEHYNTLTSEAVQRTWNEPETTTAAPEIEAGLNEATHTYDIVATGEGTVTLYVTWYDVNGTAHNEVITGEGEASFSLPQAEAVQYISYYATAKNPNDDNAGINEGESYVEVPAYVAPNKDFQGTVTVTVDANGNVSAVYNPAEGETVEPTVTVDPSKLTEYGEDIPVTVTVSADGYNTKTYAETVDYPAPVLEQTAAPSSKATNYVYKDNGVYYNAYTVELSNANTEPDAQIYYRIIKDGEVGGWILYTGEFNVTETGEYTIEAYAIAPGKSESTHITTKFTVSVATSIEELFAGKDVASVRYFNVAGQEMQEANGITIVVTTFTDGTQATVKVMK